MFQVTQLSLRRYMAIRCAQYSGDRIILAVFCYMYQLAQSFVYCRKSSLQFESFRERKLNLKKCNVNLKLSIIFLYGYLKTHACA